MTRANSEYSLLAILIIATAIIAFLPLNAVGLFPDENNILAQAKNLTGGIGSIFTPENVTDLSSKAYTYFVSVNLNVFQMCDAVAVRVPSAMVIWMLSIGIYHFRSADEKKSNSFLASLIFISSYSVSAMIYHACSLTITALVLISSFAAVYHMTKKPTRTKVLITILLTTASAYLFSIIAPITLGFSAAFFLLVQKDKNIKHYISILVLTIISATFAYLSAAILFNSRDVALQILSIDNILYPFTNYSGPNNMALQLVFSIFPWSIPIVVAIGWIIINPAWLRRKFMGIGLIRQFGAVIFILTLPTIYAWNGLSVIMMLATIYFNVPLIATFLLSQSHNHTVTWRITGCIFASLIAIFTIIYICTIYGLEISFCGFSYSNSCGWHPGSILLITAICISLYSLSRNQRTIKFNNRYLYNIVILYLLATLLYKSFINPYIVQL